ncbi:major facilitator superfamily domain-containing protein 8 [Thalassophryne amazonica]|uniref:major facilitator superfamily domain-containing protein 8 n=1 Tax=Thalassophryne amazonica TaxID=390379 RepID=UPI001471F9A1|nr:major facilitator superfamily domain-containing protein 8 [Thalassophryne amazonica]
MDDPRRKTMTFIAIGLIFFFNGVEYAVILPTVWEYLQNLDATSSFLGMCLSAFSLSGLLSGPLFGHWTDRTRSTKNAILVGNFFEIVGSLMYSVGYSKWIVLSSRLVAGVGSGVGSSIFGFLTRSTSVKDRATAIAAVMACRHGGLVIGPGLNVFLRFCNFKMGPFEVNKYTAPGIFMCLLWILLQLVVIFMFWDGPNVEKRKAQEKGASNNNMVEEKEVLEKYSDKEDDDDDDDDEERPLMLSYELLGSYGTVGKHKPHRHSTMTHNTLSAPTSSPEPQEPRGTGTSLSKWRELLREEVVVLLAAQFILLFNHTALETMVTPLTQKYFSYGELQNSVMYCLGGIEVIVGFMLVRWLSRCVPERVLMATGVTLCNVSSIWCNIFLTNPIGTYSWKLGEFIVGMFLQVLSLPILAVAQVSLYSKLTPEKTQGFSHGIRRSVGGLATILGPLWAGGLTDNMYILLGVMFALLLVLTVMLICSYKRLVSPPAEKPEETSTTSV